MSVRWNDEVKDAVNRNKNTWKEVLGDRDVAKERCMDAYREENRKLKGVYIRGPQKN